MRNTLLSSRLSGAAALLTCSLVASAAHAGPVEFLESLALDPADPNRLALHYDAAFGGYLFSHDGGRTFDLLPSLAFTASGVRDVYPPMAYLPGGELVLAAPWDGLFVSDAQGCTSGESAVMKGSVNDLVRHPRDPAVLFFVGQRNDDARLGLWQRAADGTITPLGVEDTDFTAHGLAVLERAEGAEQLRIVEVGYKSAGSESSAVLRVSDDLGQSWLEHAIVAPDGQGGRPRLLAASGSDPVKLVVALVRRGAVEPIDPVLVSTDTGATFSSYLDEVHSAGQALIAPDGKLYLTDFGTTSLEGGMWVAEEIGSPLEKIADYRVHCVGWDRNVEQLFVCKGYELGHFDPATRAYCRTYQLNETLKFACDPTSLPRLHPSDAKSTAERIKLFQTCDGWCGAKHLASSPVCAYYDDAQLVCGLAARAYDRTGEPESHWIEPPGTDELRCAGYEPVHSSADAGLADTGDAHADAGAAGEAGAPQAVDAGENPPRKRRGDGCSVQRSGSSSNGALVGLYGLIALLALRRRLGRSGALPGPGVRLHLGARRSPLGRRACRGGLNTSPAPIKA